MGSKKSTLTKCNVPGCSGISGNRTGGRCLNCWQAHGDGPSSDRPSALQSVLDREEPITPPQKLAVCYRNRPHDSLAGVPYAVWHELCVHYWTSPDGVECTLPNMIGLKAPDAVALPIDKYLSEINGDAKRQRFVIGQGAPRIVWIYPKV